MPVRLAHLPICRAVLRTRFANISDAGDTALTLDLVLERDRAPAVRRQLDRPRHQTTLVERARGDLRDLFGLLILEQVRIGRAELDVDLLDLGDRDPLG